MAGQFIVIEGLEGAGKTTALQTVSDWLEAAGVHCRQVREPGGTPLAEAIRELVKGDWQESVAAETELLLIYAARVQLVREVIQPALAQGTWVIGDRHDLSTQAYQGGGRQLPAAMLDQLRAISLGDFRPDLTLYLDIEPGLGLARARGRGELDRFEREALPFFTRTRARYQAVAAREPKVFTIDANQPLVMVQQHIRDVLEAQLGSLLTERR